METQFHKTVYPYLDHAVYQVQDQEQTLELRLPDGMPDIGRVLGVWGQPLVRSKEWQSDSMRVNCGVMVWVLYAPEEGGMSRCTQAWIPFQQSFSHSEDTHEGIMQVQCLLRSVDARTVSARKLMLRAVVNMLAQAWVNAEAEVYSPGELPDDVCLLTRTYPIKLLKEAGEKPFVMDEEMNLPPTSQDMECLVRYDMRCELIDQKVLTDKVVFRGVGVLHILYLSTDGTLHNCDLEIPISQYCNLSREYGDDACADICFAITGLELDTDAEGRLRLKAGLTGQYTIYAGEQIVLTQDAYSPRRNVSVKMQQLQLPAVLDRRSMIVPVQQSVSPETGRIADVAFYPDQPRCNWEQDRIRTELGGVFHILGEDLEGQPQSVQLRWQNEQTMDAARESRVQMRVTVSGTPQTVESPDSFSVGCDIILVDQTIATQGIPMVTGVELGQEQEPDPQRPSLILQRAENATLWELAKQSGSTVEAICRANNITDDTDLQHQMLLIPVC